jgi:outer membrane protein OmpA-like peptidoglycan-associated protein
MEKDFKNIVTTKNYKLSIIEPIYKECSTPSAEAIYYIAKAKKFEIEDNIPSTLQNYYKALSTIDENELIGFDDITLYIQNQIAKYQEEEVISSEELDRGNYILTRDAELRPYQDLRGIPINFRTGSSKIQKGVNREQVEEIGKLLYQKYRDRKIYITGFTDTRGRASYNRVLSKKRADSIKSYLIKKYHFIREKIKIDGFGEKAPICESGYKQKRGKEYFCSGKENFYKGRRVTIQIGK